MSPLATSFTFSKPSISTKIGPEHCESEREIASKDANVATKTTHSSASGIQVIEVDPLSANADVISTAETHAASSDPTSNEEQVHPLSHKELRTRLETTAELLTLRQANISLTKRLHASSPETPSEREARRFKTKNAEIEQLKASVERVHAQTEATRKRLVERQAYLRELNAQIVKLQPPLPFVVKSGRGKGRGKKGQLLRDTDMT
ncbi:hypothetical protein N0V95_004730 [Ascochyta clinopodiicola]|nr:hypothetical protein N0V95_004730 [Ascochyta clinopodiicola]